MMRFILVCIGLASAICSHAAEQRFRLAAIDTSHRPPYSWVDHCDGSVHGVVRDVIQRAFKTIDVSLERVPFQFGLDTNKRLREAMLTGQLDGTLLPISSTPDIRYGQIPVLEARAVLIYPTNNPPPSNDLEGLESLAGAIGNASGKRALADTFIPELDKLNITTIPNVNVGLELLLNGSFQYIISNKYVALANLRHSPQRSQLSVEDLDLVVYKPHYLAVSTNSPFVNKLDDFDRAIENIRKSGVEKIIYDKNLKQFIRSEDCKPRGLSINNHQD